MKKILIVLRNEIITIITRPSFWVGALGLPLVAGLIFVIVGAVNKSASASQTISQVFSGPEEMLPEGYVDLSEIITAMPESVPPGTFIQYTDEPAARSALEAEVISAFYIVPEDYLKSGIITYIRPDFNPIASSGNRSDKFTWVVEVNLLNGDWFLANLVNNPLQVEEISLEPTNLQFEATSPMVYFIPYAVTLLIYMLIITSSSLLLGNISKEKENRVIEVLLTSVTPRQLLTGKILGLGILGLGQAVLWLGTSYLLLNKSSQVFQMVAQINIPFSFLAWGIVFFLLGYAVYASLMAGLGAMAPNLREASQTTFVVMIPLLIPLFFASTVFAEDPHGPIATVLSIFPLTAPVAMMSRLASGGVPVWQPWLAAVLTLGTAVFIVRAVANMFRAQSLLAGRGFNVKVYLRALVGKV
jgi:ABC-2 type transport system permease protein